MTIPSSAVESVNPMSEQNRQPNSQHLVTTEDQMRELVGDRFFDFPISGMNTTLVPTE